MAAILILLPLNLGAAVTLQEPSQPDTVVGNAPSESAGESSSSASKSRHDAESPEGRERLQEIEQLARRLNGEREDVERERRPFALKRDAMLGEITLARERMARNQVAAALSARQLSHLDYQIKWLSGSEARQLQSQRSRTQSQLNSLTRSLTADRKLIDDRATQVNALNLQMDSLEQRLLRLDENLSECRQQWLRIRQPLQKYGWGDFEGLRRVLDDWLVLDAQWPEAQAWGALCAYELAEIDAAAIYLEKAQALRAGRTRSPRKWPQLEALTALIRQKQPGQSARADAALSQAIRLADRDSDWETYFLVGRYYSERPGDGERAKAYYQRALAICPDADCVRLWLARLQTVSTLPDVRDPEAAAATLEQLWKQSGQGSRRLARFLADARSASRRSADAEVRDRTLFNSQP